MVADLAKLVGSGVELLALVGEKRRLGAERVLVLSVHDISGEVEVELMEKSCEDEVEGSISPGDLVRIRGRVGKREEKLRLYAEMVERAPKEGASPEQFLPSATRSRDEMLYELFSRIESIGNRYLKSLCEAVFGDKEFLEDFSVAPGSKAVHHARLGGLLEHTLEVVRLCEEVAKLFPGIGRDLLITAALLHDVGKVKDYSWDLKIDRTDEGRLLGHVVLGAFLVEEKIGEIEGLPEELRVKVLHCILSHMGKEEFGSPVKPMIPEAFALYHVDHMLAHTVRSLDIVAELKKRGESWLKKPDWALGSLIYAGREEEG